MIPRWCLIVLMIGSLSIARGVAETDTRPVYNFHSLEQARIFIQSNLPRMSETTGVNKKSNVTLVGHCELSELQATKIVISCHTHPVDSSSTFPPIDDMFSARPGDLDVTEMVTATADDHGQLERDPDSNQVKILLVCKKRGCVSAQSNGSVSKTDIIDLDLVDGPMVDPLRDAFSSAIRFSLRATQTR
jgi:hypothetical protein